MEQRTKHLETLLVIALGMMVFFLFTQRVEFLYVGLGIGAVGLTIPLAGKYIFLGWMGLSRVLGFVNSHIILALVFFLFLSPLALIRRLGRKDGLQLRKRSQGSYFAVREHLFEAQDMQNPW